MMTSADRTRIALSDTHFVGFDHQLNRAARLPGFGLPVFTPGRRPRPVKPPFKYLFVDDRWIAETYGVHRKPGAFEKHPHNPILVPDQPWEGNGLECFGTCIEEDSYRLWYQVYVFDDKDIDTRFRTAVGYAESDDGINWRKPLVGVVHPQFGKTNLLALSSGRSHLCSPAVVRDDKDPDPSRRYKMLYFDSMHQPDLDALGSPFPACSDVPGWRGIHGEGLFVSTSPDGITWQRAPRPVVGDPCDASSLAQLSDGRFLATFKTSLRPDRHFRVVAESGSDDFVAWSAPSVVLEPDWRDPPGTEFYGMAAFDYFGNRLGLLWMYHNAPDDKRMDIQLAAWDERLGWRRANGRQPLLPVGGRGDWDAATLLTSSAPLVAPRVDPESLWLYYGGGNVRHDDSRYRRNAIGLARLRLDGFAAMESRYFPGTLRTKTVRPSGNLLHVNADARHGCLSVIAIDAENGEILGRTRELQGQNGTKIALPWQDLNIGRMPEALILEFALKDAALYAFWFE